MGNSANKQDPTLGSLVVQSSQKYYYPGDMVTGCVYLRLLRPIQAKKIDLQIHGREKVSFMYYHDNNMHKTTTRHVIFNKKEMVYVFSEPLLKNGDYQIPFQFTLPSGLPSSMMWRNMTVAEQPKCEVKYFIRAYLNHDNNKNMIHKQLLILKERISPQNML